MKATLLTLLIMSVSINIGHAQSSASPKVSNRLHLGVWQQATIGCEEPANTVANFARTYLSKQGVTVIESKNIKENEQYLFVRLSCRGLPSKNNSAIFFIEVALSSYSNEVIKGATKPVVMMKLTDYSDIGQGTTGDIVVIGKEYVEMIVKDYLDSNEL